MNSFQSSKVEVSDVKFKFFFTTFLPHELKRKIGIISKFNILKSKDSSQFCSNSWIKRMKTILIVNRLKFQLKKILDLVLYTFLYL